MPARLLAKRDVAIFMLGRVVSELGSRITREGLPIVAILVVGATARQVSLLAALASLAAFGVAPWAGVAVDRVRRRPLMIGADIVRAAALLTVPAAALAGRLSFPQIAAVTALVGGLTVVFDVADQAWLPQFVGRRRLGEGNALVSGASATGEMGGPVLMGALIQWVGGPMAILFDALSYIVSAVTLGRIREREPRPRPGGASRAVAGEAAAGLRAMLAHPLLRPLAFTVATRSLCGGFFGALYEIFALRTLRLTPFAVGLLITSGGVGALAGSALASPAARRLGTGRTLWLAAASSGALAFLVPLAPARLGPAFVALFLAQICGDMAGTVFGVNEAVVRQSVTPDGWLGRVTGAESWLASILVTAGALLAWGLAGSVPVRGILFMAAAGEAVAPLWLVFSRLRALREPGVPEPARFIEAAPQVGAVVRGG